MKLFTVGPVMMRKETLLESATQLPYARTEQFSYMMKDIEHMLKQVVDAREDDKVFMITGSGTCAMEAVVSSCFDEHDHVLIIDGGSFGERFVELCDIYHVPYTKVSLSFQEALTKQHFDAYKNERFTAILVNIHETSTGQLYDLSILKEFALEKGIPLVVDAISAVLADDISMKLDALDVVIMSSQKAFALAPGLSMIVMSDSFFQAYAAKKQPKTMYLNLVSYEQNMRRGQTPFTPAVGIVITLWQRLQQILHDGVKKEQEAVIERAKYFRKLCKQHGFHIPETYPLSNALTPIYFVDGCAKEIYQYLVDKKGYYVTPSGGALANYLLRIGHIGELSLHDYDALIEAMLTFYTEKRKKRKMILMAAGMGTRIAQAANGPKSLLKIGEEPLIEHTVKLLLENDFEVHIVLGYEGKKIKEALQAYPVIFHDNPFYRSTNSIASLWFVKEELLSGQEIYLANADVYWEQDLLDQLIACEKDVMMLMDERRKLCGDYFFGCENGLLRHYGKDLNEDLRSGEYVGIAKVQPSFVRKLYEQLEYLVALGEYQKWWEDALYTLLDTECIHVEDVCGKFWSEIDVYEDYLRILSYKNLKQ